MRIPFTEMNIAKWEVFTFRGWRIFLKAINQKREKTILSNVLFSLTIIVRNKSHFTYVFDQ